MTHVGVLLAKKREIKYVPSVILQFSLSIYIPICHHYLPKMWADILRGSALFWFRISHVVSMATTLLSNLLASWFGRVLTWLLYWFITCSVLAYKILAIKYMNWTQLTTYLNFKLTSSLNKKIYQNLLGIYNFIKQYVIKISFLFCNGHSPLKLIIIL